MGHVGAFDALIDKLRPLHNPNLNKMCRSEANYR